MMEEHGSIRDQLLKILQAKSLRVASVPTAPPRPAMLHPPTPDHARRSEAQRDDSWKMGVRPLKGSIRYPSRSPPKVPVGTLHRTGAAGARRPIERPIRKFQRQAPTPRAYDRLGARPAASPVKGTGPAESLRPSAPTPTVTPVASPPRLSEPAHFKLPDAWVTDGCLLQPHQGGSRSLPIRLGIDFGTAFTKMAIGLANQVFLVDWDGIHAGEQRYLLGGEISEMTSGDAFVGRATEATSVMTDLKLPFLKLERSSTLDDIATAAIFLAWTMKYARAWLYRHHASILGGNQLVWEVNLGAPTGTWAAGSLALRDEYRRLGLTAWRLSQEPHINIIQANALLAATAASTSGFGLDALAVLPEFAAQIAGYVRSPQRQDGLHLLADIGAGTLDVACFRVMKDAETGSNRFPVFASKVEPIGTHFLMRVRASQSGSATTGWESTQRVPTKSEYAKKTGIPIDLVSAADKQFANLVANAVGAVLFYTRNVMDRTAPEFGATGVMPVFLAGGGATVEPYRTGIATAFGRLKLHHRIRPFPADNIPEARFSIDDEVCNRLSVARGLTNDAEGIGQLIPTREIPPDNPITTRKTPDRDELYPK